MLLFAMAACSAYEKKENFDAESELNANANAIAFAAMTLTDFICSIEVFVFAYLKEAKNLANIKRKKRASQKS